MKKSVMAVFIGIFFAVTCGLDAQVHHRHACHMLSPTPCVTVVPTATPTPLAP